MAIQICPKCENKSFTWVVDEKDTVWYCSSCNYSAIENESLERICAMCNSKTEIRLTDSEQEFWWCNNCNAINK